LAPTISPGKTIEGSLGSLAVMLIWALVLFFIYRNNDFSAISALIVATGLAVIIGDLLESLLKRASGVKDSGNLLPGHGGLLDRVDSLLAAAPVYTFLLMILSIKF
jgi:phosphatidate cytidylyltransferase